MKTLIMIPLLLITVAAEGRIGARGFHLGQKVDKEIIQDWNLVVFADEGTLLVKEILSFQDLDKYQSTLDYLTKEYGTFNNISFNYEQFKVHTLYLKYAVIEVTNNNEYIEIKYIYKS